MCGALTVVLICIYLIIGNVDCHFMYFLTICMSSLENVYLYILYHFLIGFCCFILSHMNCLHILEINPSFVTLFSSIYYHSMGFLLHSVDSSLCCTKAFKFRHFCYFLLFHYSRWWITEKIFMWFMLKGTTYIFFKYFL